MVWMFSVGVARNMNTKIEKCGVPIVAKKGMFPETCTKNEQCSLCQESGHFYVQYSSRNEEKQYTENKKKAEEQKAPPRREAENQETEMEEPVVSENDIGEKITRKKDKCDST